MTTRRTLALALTAAALGAPLRAQAPRETPAQRDARMAWWRDARFGMFIHWGLYAVPARGEWYMENNAILPDTYRKYAFDQGDGVYFDAKDYDPAEWARIAKDAGMKYMCLTARHHDG